MLGYMFINLEFYLIILTVFFFLIILNYSNTIFINTFLIVILIKFNILNLTKITITSYNLFFVSFLENKATLLLTLITLSIVYKLKFNKFNYLNFFLFSLFFIFFLNNFFINIISLQKIKNFLDFSNSDYTFELINGIFFLHPFFFFLSLILFNLKLFNQFNCILKNKHLLLQKNNLIQIYYNYNYNYNLFILMILLLFSGSWWAQQEVNWNGWWSWDNIELITFIELIIIFISLHFIFFYKKKINLNFLIIIFFFLALILIRFNLMLTRHTFLVEPTDLQFYIYGFLFIFLLFFLYSNLVINNSYKLNESFIFFKYNTLKLKLYSTIYLNNYLRLYFLYFILYVSYYILSIVIDYFNYYFYILSYIGFDCNSSFYYIFLSTLFIQFFINIEYFFFKFKNKFQFLLNDLTIFYKIYDKLNLPKNNFLSLIHLPIYLFWIYFYIYSSLMDYNPIFFCDFFYYDGKSLKDISYNLKLTNFCLNFDYNFNSKTFIENLNYDIGLTLLNVDILNNQNIDKLFGYFSYLTFYDQNSIFISALNSIGLDMVVTDLFWVTLFIIIVVFLYKLKLILKKKANIINLKTIFKKEFIKNISFFNINLKEFNLELNNLLSLRLNVFVKKKLMDIKENIFILNPYYKFTKKLIIMMNLNQHKYRILNQRFYKNFPKIFTKKKKRKPKRFYKYYFSNKKENNIILKKIIIFKRLLNLKKQSLFFKNTYNQDISFKEKIIKKKTKRFFFLIKNNNNYTLNKITSKNKFKVKRKKLHLIFVTKLKIKIKKKRIFYQVFLKKKKKQLTKFFSNLSNLKVISYIYLTNLLGNIFYFIPSFKINNFIKNKNILVNKSFIRSKFFLLFRYDLIEIVLFKQLFISLFFNFYLKLKNYRNLVVKRWWKYLREKTPLVRGLKWKNYTLKSINKLDKLNTYLLYKSFFNFNFQKIEIDFKTLSFFLLNLSINNQPFYKNNTIFDKLFNGNVSKYKLLNWKYIN